MSPYDEMVAERFNKLARANDILTKENARLRDNGRIDSYLQTLRALTKLAVDVGIPDAESTGHDTLVFQLREKFAKLKANQLPAGAVFFVPTGEVRVAEVGDWHWNCYGEMSDGREPLGIDRTIYRRVEAQGAEPVNSQFPTQEYLATENKYLRHECDMFVDQRDQATAQLLAVEAERDALRQEVERLRASRDYHERRSNMFAAESKANQEAADVLRLIESRDLTVEAYRGSGGWTATGRGAVAHGITALASVKAWAQCHGITLPAKDENASQPQEDLEVTWGDRGVGVAYSLPPEPEPAAESGETCKYTISRDGCNLIITLPSPYEKGRDNEILNCYGSPSYANDICAYLNGTSPVHQQLAEARAAIDNLNIALNESNDTIERYAKENVDLRRDREAWDAVRQMKIQIYVAAADCCMAYTQWPDERTEWLTDPREAVLALAKTLEAGQ